MVADKQNMANLLDGRGVTKSGQPADLSILDEAAIYNVDLATLEITDKKKTSENLAKNKHSQSSDKSEDWVKLDVKLSDMIDFVFDKADFPVFIVQDDSIIYVNRAVGALLQLDGNSNLIGHKFFELVYQEDWNLLANNIADMLTNHKEISVRFNCNNDKIQEVALKAVYLPDIEHFSFIIFGEKLQSKKKITNNALYDEDTGLPSFFLFEDRLQMAVLMANSIKEEANRQNIGVLAINIDNMKDFKKLNLDDVVVKKLADNLVFNLPKTITVAKGLKYHFWILLNGVHNDSEMKAYLKIIKEILDAGISDNFMRHDLVYSVGCSLFPNDASSAKELVKHTIEATRLAQSNNHNSLVIYNGK